MLGRQHVIFLPFVSNQLVISVVLEAKWVAVSGHLMVLDLLQRCDQVRRRVPCGLALGKTLLHLGTDAEVIGIVPDCSVGVRETAVVSTGVANSQNCGRNESRKPHLGE